VDAPQKQGSDKLTRVLVGVAGALLLAVLALLFFFVGRETAPEKATKAGTATEASGGVTSNFDYSILNDIRDILTNNYVKPDNLDDQALYENAINGLLNTLSDAGTFYVDPETFKVSVLPSGTFDGIGATVAQQNNEIVIVAPIKGTPAEAAGIKSGDVVLAVDGESTKGWSTEKTVLRIRGPRGTKVTVTIRHSDGKTEDYVLTRSQVNVESVTTVPPAGGGALRDANGQEVPSIGYIKIREFTARTPGEMDVAVTEVTNAGAKALIIDVRGNPGGVLNATVSVADMFLDSGTILTQRDRDGRERVFTARSGQSVNKGVPIVIIQNRFSASASEVLAAALHDNGRATIVGEKSFGKGTVNISKELKDGGALFVSIAEWLTPTGTVISKIGIRPDVEVIPTDAEIDQRLDPQLLKAIDVLRSQLAKPGATTGP
jgi:carboxyl-terminal processing protease